MFSILIFLCLCLGACRHGNNVSNSSGLELQVKAEPMLISQLGNEHFGNAVYRRGINGPSIAASGSRILEWQVQQFAPTMEVVPASAGNYQNGACVIDINNNNVDEMIVGRSSGDLTTDLLWFEEIAGQSHWKEHFIASVSKEKGAEGLHDIMPFEAKISGKMVQGVVVLANRNILYWYEIPDDFAQPWKEHKIADLKKYGAECAQSGLVTGDIAGNGRQDIVCGNFWAECPADPTVDSWEIHRYSNWDIRTTPVFPGVPTWVNDTRFGGMNQLDLGDMNSDGMVDIVATDAEIPEARVGVFCRDMNDPRSLWNVILIDTGLYCPHSLVVTDVNADSRPDIIIGEMTAGGWMFPGNSDPKLYLYLNQGNLKFEKYVLHSGWGIHMMRMASHQADNKTFIFGADEIQPWYEDMTTHVVGWTIHLPDL